MAGPAFTEREVFDEILKDIRTADGSSYRDLRTIYGDMSRPVVGILAEMSVQEITALYNDLGWGGSANARALHEAAKAWMRRYRDSAGD